MSGEDDISPVESTAYPSDGSSYEIASPSWKERCCMCSFWIKYSLFIINFLVWIAGIVMLAIGVWARIQKRGLDFFDHLMTDPAYIMIVVGLLMFLISIFGCVGALRENICLLRTFIAVITLVFIIQIVAGILAFVLMDRFEVSMMDYMRHSITHYGDNDDIRDAIDYLQEQFYCCGASSYADWEVNPYYNCSSEALSQCGVPRSCCKLPTSAQCGFGVRKYLEDYADQMVFTQGCIGALIVVFKDNLIIIGLIAMCVGFLELFSMLLANGMIRYIYLEQKLFQ